jgi:hypothetical protein
MSSPAPRVIEVLASGPAEGGGIGQFVRYLTAENETLRALDLVATVDPRGPGAAYATAWRLPMALAHLLILRLAHFSSPPTLHLHIAGRLSTWRKCVVILWARLIGFVCVAHYHEYGYAKFLTELARPLQAFPELQTARESLVLDLQCLVLAMVLGLDLVIGLNRAQCEYAARAHPLHGHAPY